MKSDWRLGLPLALTTAMLWGILPIALTAVLAGMNAFTVTWYRFVIAACILTSILAMRHGLPKLGTLSGRAWRFIGLAIAGLAGNYVIFLLGLHRTSPTVAQVVSQLGPLFLMLSGVFLFREHLRVLQRMGVAALVFGLLLFFNRRLLELSDLSGGFGLGVALLLSSAVVWTLYGTSQKALQPHLGAQHILLLLYTGSAAVLLPLASPAQISSLSGVQLALLAFCGINTLIAYGAFAESLKHWEVSRVGAVLATTPLFTLASVWVVGHIAPTFVQPEHLNALSILGALMVALGSALCALGGGVRSVVAAPVPASPS